MANKKISDFESALLNNTKIIKNSQKETSENKQEDFNVKSIDISPDVLQKYNELAKKHNLNANDLISLALNHFLDMENVFFNAD
jgi:hypothetical protein